MRQELAGLPCARFRPYFDNATGLRARTVAEGVPRADTPDRRLAAGSPYEKTLTFREHFGDYQRQLFLMDHAGLPLKTVLEQLDLLGEEVVPVLRRELDAARPAHVPEAPTHASLLAAAQEQADTADTADTTDLEVNCPMSDTTSRQTRVVVVSGGAGGAVDDPNLADRLATAVRTALDDPSSEVSVLRTARHRPRHHDASAHAESRARRCRRRWTRSPAPTDWSW
jgi:hypothetical protein